MAYSDQSEFPKGKVVLTAITNTPQTVFAAGARVKLCHLECSNPDTVANTLIFRAVGGGAEILRVSIPTTDSAPPIPGFEVPSTGMEVLTSAAITVVGLNVTAFYLL